MTDPRVFIRQTQVLGEPAQRALVGSSLRAPENATTRDYLERAGVVFTETGEATCEAGAEPEELVADARLLDATQALLGAFAAVETVKASTGLGTQARWPRGLRLDDEAP